jgi:hypothetical protein
MNQESTLKEVDNRLINQESTLKEVDNRLTTLETRLKENSILYLEQNKLLEDKISYIIDTNLSYFANKIEELENKLENKTVVNDDTILSSNIIPENIKQEISEEVSEELIKENKLSDSKKQKTKATPVMETHI